MQNHIYHTVYLSYEEGLQGRNYVGKHSTNNPYDDYLGSFHDLTFKPVGKFVLAIYKTPQAATQGEIMWQNALNVVKDPSYVNRSFQTAIGFDTTGRKRPIEETRGGGLAAGSLPFWNNGEVQVRSKECPGPGWLKGKLALSDEHKQRISDSISKQIWWNNGSNEVRSVNRPGSDWVEGRINVTTNRQLWQCTITGYVSTPGPLSRYQAARGIDPKDPTNRLRL